ncbi:sulfite exporter TauE/SafE family protein [Ruoffia sp. FAM 26255]|uniref:sulfite exporter TauE/SafE family protein n=1 Tax=Ruoffia sp. FAM 26255 TaxID=3259519 RepID=UPI0038874EE5
MLLNTILVLIVLVNGTFILQLVKDLIAHKQELRTEPGNPIALAFSQFIIFFLSTFGISDFAIGASLYPKAKWVEDEKLPGTLNTACVVPVAAMALAYISSIEVGLATLLIPIIAQVIGAYISPRFVVKLPKNTIKKFVIAGLLVAAGLILAGKLGVYPAGGTETSLSGIKLIALGLLSMLYGALNNIGIGSYALTMATIYAFGLHPGVAFPIMMGACTFSVPVGSLQFIKLDSYSRKITLFSATFGVIGVLVAAFLVKGLDTNLLQWIVLVVIFYSVYSMVMDLRQDSQKKVAFDQNMEKHA